MIVGVCVLTEENDSFRNAVPVTDRGNCDGDVDDDSDRVAEMLTDVVFDRS